MHSITTEQLLALYGKNAQKEKDKLCPHASQITGKQAGAFFTTSWGTRKYDDTEIMYQEYRA